MAVAVQEVPEALEILLGADYDELAPLREDGGLSRLFRARHLGLGMDVVIKRMKMNPRSPLDVKQEARVMTGLRHQFLPRIIDFKTDSEEYCYTIMELIPGCTLRHYVERQGALDQKTVLFWMKQLCQVTAYMHSRRPPIIHSDIKPENIMVTPDGNLCLIDFNASLELRDDGVEAVAATVCYAAPEQYNVPLERFPPRDQMSESRRAVYNMACQAQGMGKVTARTDLYAIGATAYFMLTGYDPPCWNEPPVPLERFEILLSDPLRQVIERCMRVEAGQRFSSAQELNRALENLARLDKRYRDWRRSCQLAALTVGAGLILSSFCAVWGWLTMRQADGRAYNDLISQAQQYEEQLDFPNAEELLFEAIQLDGQRPEAFANLAGILYRQGEYRQAIELLTDQETDGGTLDDEQALAAQGQSQYVLANCYYQLEEYHQALPCYQTAAALCPAEPAYCRELAVCCARLGYQDQAEAALAVLAKLDTRPGDTELAAGEIAAFSGAYEEGLDLLEEALRVSQDPAVLSRASLQGAQCCRQLGSDWLPREIGILESAVNRLGVAENGAQLQALADALLRQAAARPEESAEKYAQALACLEELMGRGQPAFAVRQSAALVLQALERYSEAEPILLQLQEEFPGDYRPPMRLGLLYAQWREDSGKDWRQAVREAYETASKLYEAQAPVPDADMERLAELAGQL